MSENMGDEARTEARARAPGSSGLSPARGAEGPQVFLTVEQVAKMRRLFDLLRGELNGLRGSADYLARRVGDEDRDFRRAFDDMFFVKFPKAERIITELEGFLEVAGA